MKLRPLDYAERNGYVRGVVRDLIHDPGRGAPIVKVQFNNPYKYKKDNYQWTATEGTYTGQFIYCGKKGTLSAPTCPLPRHAARVSCSPWCMVACRPPRTGLSGTRWGTLRRATGHLTATGRGQRS